MYWKSLKIQFNKKFMNCIRLNTRSKYRSTVWVNLMHLFWNYSQTRVKFVLFFGRNQKGASLIFFLSRVKQLRCSRDFTCHFFHLLSQMWQTKEVNRTDLRMDMKEYFTNNSQHFELFSFEPFVSFFQRGNIERMKWSGWRDGGGGDLVVNEMSVCIFLWFSCVC